MSERAAESDVDGRVCTGCNLPRPWSDFHHFRYGRNGRKSRCFECVATDDRARRTKDVVVVDVESEAVLAVDSLLCRRCAEPFPIDDFSPTRLGRMGRRARCKRCEAELAKESRKRTADEAVASGSKGCSKCKEVKPLDAFPTKASALDGRARACTACTGVVSAPPPDPMDAERSARWHRRRQDFATAVEEHRRERGRTSPGRKT